MAWTNPTAPAASSLITTSFWTAQITNNLLETAPAKFSAKGDGFFATGANAGARVAVAASGLLIADSTCNAGVRWSTCATVNASTGEFRNTAAADVSPFTQARLTVYRDTSNWGYLAYGSDGVLRTVYSSDVGVKSTHWGISNSTSGTGAFTAWMALTTCGVLTIGGSVVNANMTTGLTIQQGAADDEILALKSSDVAHGMTSLTETDTYGTLRKHTDTLGGLWIGGYSEGGQAALIQGRATTESTTRTTSSCAPVEVDSQIKSGTTTGTPSASANIFCIKSGQVTQFMFDGQGNSYENIGTVWTNFDEHDDAHLLNILAAHATLPNDPIRESFREFLKESRDQLQELGLVYFNPDGNHFLNTSRLAMLHTGAIRQGYQRDMKLAERMERLEQAVFAAGIDPKLLDPPYGPG